MTIVITDSSYHLTKVAYKLQKSTCAGWLRGVETKKSSASPLLHRHSAA